MRAYVPSRVLQIYRSTPTMMELLKREPQPVEKLILPPVYGELNAIARRAFRLSPQSEFIREWMVKAESEKASRTMEQMRAQIAEVTEKAGGEFPTEIFVVDDVIEPDILAITRDVARGG